MCVCVCVGGWVGGCVCVWVCTVFVHTHYSVCGCVLKIDQDDVVFCLHVCVRARECACVSVRV